MSCAPLITATAATSCRHCCVSARLPPAASPNASRKIPHARCPQLRPRASGGDDAGPSTSQASQNSDDLPIEQQIASRRRPGKAAKAEAPFKVIAPTRDQVLGAAPLTADQELEGKVVSTLALLFLAIMAEGVFLAASGFVSEGADQFAQDFVYPAFSPTVVVFLVCSTVYGLWKTRGGGGGESGKSG